MSRRLSAVLSSDVVGYSRAMGLDEAGTLAIVKSHRRDVFDPRAEYYGGRTIKLMGDGALMEFASVINAVAFAVDVQSAIAKRNAVGQDDQRLVYRVGVNLGDIIAEGDDIFGDGVNIAARLQALADSGGICISDAVHTQVRGKLDLTYEDMGPQAVKNISEPVPAYRVVLDDSAAGLPVQVAVTMFIAQSVVLSRLPEFWRENPDIRVSMIPSYEVVDIPALGFDLAIRGLGDSADLPELNAELLCESKFKVVGAPNLVGDDIPDLKSLPWIWNRGSTWEEAKLRAAGLDPDLLDKVDIGSSMYEISAAIQGMGLTIAPEIVVREELATDRLREVPSSGLGTQKYYAVTPKGPVRPQAAKFIEWLKQIFAE